MHVIDSVNVAVRKTNGIRSRFRLFGAATVSPCKTNGKLSEKVAIRGGCRVDATVTWEGFEPRQNLWQAEEIHVSTLMLCKGLHVRHK